MTWYFSALVSWTHASTNKQRYCICYLAKGLHNEVLVRWQNLHNEAYTVNSNLSGSMNQGSESALISGHNQTQPVQIRRQRQCARRIPLKGSWEPWKQIQEPVDREEVGCLWRRKHAAAREPRASIARNTNGQKAVTATQSLRNTSRQTGPEFGPEAPWGPGWQYPCPTCLQSL